MSRPVLRPRRRAMGEPRLWSAWCEVWAGFAGRILAVTLASILLGLVTSPAAAQSTTPAAPAATDPTMTPSLAAMLVSEFVRTPDDVGAPAKPRILDYFVPDWREQLKTLPPFFRDTDLHLKWRTFYFNRQNDNPTANEALATGGWISYASGLLLDTFSMGATYYTSLPLYA